MTIADLLNQHQQGTYASIGDNWGDINNPEHIMGPLVNKNQYERVQSYIKLGQEEGATLFIGGKARPDKSPNGNGGYFVELHDAYTSSEIQTYEDMGLCKYGDGGKFVEQGHPELTGFIRENHIKMAILTVPAQHAQAVVNELTAAGIQAILNFSPVVLEVPKSVIVNNVDLAMELENLSYFIR